MRKEEKQINLKKRNIYLIQCMSCHSINLYSDLFWEQHYNIQELEISYGEEADKNLKQYGLPEAVETLIERGEYDNKESEVTKVS